MMQARTRASILVFHPSLSAVKEVSVSISHQERILTAAIRGEYQNPV